MRSASEIVTSWLRKSAEQSSPEQHPSIKNNVRRDTSVDYLDQARWLWAIHHARSEAMTVRAVGLLGFNGVVLALFLQGATIENFEATRTTWILVATTLVLLLSSSVCSLLTIITRASSLPKIRQVREQWRRTSARENGQPLAVDQFAEGLLLGRNLDRDSPIDTMSNLAHRRATLLTAAVTALTLGLGSIVALVINILLQVW